MINFLNHYLLMNFIFQIGFGLNNFYTLRTLKHNCDKCDYEHNCKKDLRKHIFNLQKEIRFILSLSSKNTTQEKSSWHQSDPCSGTRSSCFEKKHLAHKWLFAHWSAVYLQEPCWNLMHMLSSINSDFFHNFLVQPCEDTPDRVDEGWDEWVEDAVEEYRKGFVPADTEDEVIAADENDSNSESEGSLWAGTKVISNSSWIFWTLFTSCFIVSLLETQLCGEIPVGGIGALRGGGWFLLNRGTFEQSGTFEDILEVTPE